MARTAWIYDDRFLDHDTGPNHPERPDRLRAIVARMQSTGLSGRVTPLSFGPATDDVLRLNHAQHYIERVELTCAAGKSHIDTVDSAICPESDAIARLAAGGVIAAVDAVMAGAADNAFCAVRPPGHHAEHELSMGFCLYNNVAIAARHLRKSHGIERVLILDWDVHHGNGTQHSFEGDPNVFFCSFHEHPRFCYPGTGFPEETGRGAGKGTTLNICMMPGATDADYRKQWEEQFEPAARAFAPQFILVSAGFDAHANDPLAQINLTDEAFVWMADRIVKMAREMCGGKLVCILEGGYDLEALSTGVCNVVRVMLDA